MGNLCSTSVSTIQLVLPIFPTEPTALPILITRGLSNRILNKPTQPPGRLLPPGASHYNASFTESPEKSEGDRLREHKRAILFDLDGTLIDTTDLILQCFQHSWIKVCGFSHSREVLLETFGMPLRNAMQRLQVRASKADEEVVEQLLVEYRSYNVANHDRLAVPFAGAPEVLSELRRRDYLIGVVTSKGRELAIRGIGMCSLTGLIDAGVFLEDTDIHKPHPEPILAALGKLGASASSAAYVGDSRHDIVAARAAGVRAVAALWGPALQTDLEREQPDFTAGSLVELLEIFD